ncbi:MAG: hypothetical protein AB7F89_01030 [Pirellulaceae bacterium]
MVRRIIRVAAPRLLAGAILWVATANLPAQDNRGGNKVTAAALHSLNLAVLTDAEQQTAATLLARDLDARYSAASRRESADWQSVTTREAWERFRDIRLNRLRASLTGHDLLDRSRRTRETHSTGTVTGPGYRIERLVWRAAPAAAVTANLYLPARTAGDARAPAIVVTHSHHNPKSQGELQDMGILGARAGWITLVMDMLGHGERRQHPFASADSFPAPFAVGRQDYYFRYNTGVQLHLIGESLMGWMVHDVMCGIDLLAQRPDVDPDRILVLGAVAGGGDPAAVSAALDQRVRCVVPFNFGGYQPDYPIPEDAEESMYYFGVAYWETTRCLRLGARDGFAHWMIAASVAPRALICGHEFAWPRADDPTWPRIQRVFALHQAEDRLGVATGRGSLRGTPPESTHCNNVGPEHRQGIYPLWQQWFDMAPPPAPSTERHSPSELQCLTPALVEALPVRPVHQLAADLATNDLRQSQHHFRQLPSGERRSHLRAQWARWLGPCEPSTGRVIRTAESAGKDWIQHSTLLETEPGTLVPLVVLRPAPPPSTDKSSNTTVLLLATAGKDRLLAERADEIAELLNHGLSVALVDVRGTGETSVGSDAGPQGATCTYSMRAQLFGETLLGQRLRDLRTVLRHLRGGQPASDLPPAGAFVLWGDSLAAANPPDRSPAVPWRVANPNTYSEPGGALLALLGSVFEDDVVATVARGGLISYASILDSPFFYTPHAALLPGVLQASDIPALVAGLADRPLRWERTVDGLNRPVSATDLHAEVADWLEPDRFPPVPRWSLGAADADAQLAVDWLVAQLPGSLKERE